jgi:hypothetical protein
MEHILNDILSQYGPNFQGLIFGFIHTCIMLIGYYTGFSINRFFKIISNGYIAGIIGAALSHVVADIIASAFDPNIRFAMVGIAIGGIIPFIAIPFLERWVVKSKHHIIVGDHEDIKEDIETKHK